MANALRVSSNIEAKRDRRVRIRIDNPHPTGNKSTSIECAVRYVAAKRAEWSSSTSIRFVDVRIAEWVGYDTAARSGCATADQLRGVPVLGNLTKLITIARKQCA